MSIEKAQDLDHVAEYILFTLKGEWLAIASSCLSEVLEPLHVSALPLVPPFVDGLINVNGEIVPQINLAKFVGSYESVNDELETLIVINVAGSALALKVGMVQEPLQLNAEQLQAIDIDAEASAKQPYFSHSFTYQGKTARVFSEDSLQGVFSTAHAKSNERSSSQSFLGEIGGDAEHEHAELAEYLKVRCRDQVYACLLTEIYEVVDVTSIAKQPGSPEPVTGVALIRNVPTLVLDLSLLLNQRQEKNLRNNAVLSMSSATTESSLYSLLVVRQADVYCGLLVDEVIGLELVAPEQLHQGSNGWEQAILSAEGDVLAQAISIDEFFDDSLRQSYKPFMPSVEMLQQQQRVKQRELFCFQLAGDRYAFYLQDVLRILSDKSVQPFLQPHGFLLGALEFEGTVTPVIDLPAQLGYQLSDDLKEYIVVNDQDSDWAIAIEAIDQIIAVDEPAIDILCHSDQGVSNLGLYVAGYTTVNDALLTILDVSAICQVNVNPREAG